MVPTLPVLGPRTALLTSTVLSSSYPTAVKLIYAADTDSVLTAPVLTAIRFVIMATVAQAFILRPAERQRDPAGFWPAAVELGFWATAGAQLNTAALSQIGVVRGTILLATINILTPTLSAIIGTSEAQRRVAPRTWLACALALASTIYALSDDLSAASTTLATRLLPVEYLPGDEMALGAACCYATGQVRLSSLLQQQTEDTGRAQFMPERLAAARLQTQAACSLLFLPLAGGVPLAAASGGDVAMLLSSASEWSSHISPTQVGLLCLSASVAVVGLLLQYEGQKVVPASEAQPIYASSPVLSALWAYAVLSEPITSSEAVGGLGIGGAALLAATSGKEEKQENENRREEGQR